MRNLHVIPPKQALIGVFFASGFAGLMYEIVWTRMLVFIFGNTAHSVAIIIATFMAGLAIGSFLFGKIADHTQNLLKLYSLLELGVALFGVLSPVSIWLAKILYGQVGHFLINQGTWEIVIKSVLSVLILLPPTICMGATLPVLIRYFTRNFGFVAKQTGILYGVNTLGAVFGVLTASFILIELTGLWRTLLTAATINLMIFLISFYFSNKTEMNIKVTFTPPREKHVLSKISQKQIWLLIGLYSISGFIAISYEILWTRLIAPAAGIYIYGFTLMLAMYLLGIALGSLIYEKFLSQKVQIFSWLGRLQILLSLSACLVVVFVAYFIPIWTIYLFRLSVPAIVFLPATTLMGMMFPLVIKTFEFESNIGQKIGLVYGFNSLGSILGSFITGFILIPLIGTVETVFLMAILNAILGFILFLQSEPRTHQKAGLLAGVITISLNIYGLYHAQSTFLPRIYKVYSRDYQKFPDVKTFVKEDSVASLFVITSPEPRKHKGLYIDGISTTGLVEETKLIAHLPLLVHPNPKNVLVIAFGMGTTYRSALSYPETLVEAVELVPAIPSLMPFFHSDGEKILRHHRGEVIINDGRNFLFVTNKRYDVVTIDPPPPTNGAGTTVLFSDEFYKDIKRKLNPGGVVQNWIHFDIDKESIAMMTKTFAHNFEYMLVFAAPNGKGIYLLGSDVPITLTQKRVNEALASEQTYQDFFEWMEPTDAYAWLKTKYIGDKRNLEAFHPHAPLITDYHPRTEYSLLRSIFRSQPVLTEAEFYKSFPREDL